MEFENQIVAKTDELLTNRRATFPNSQRLKKNLSMAIRGRPDIHADTHIQSDGRLILGGNYPSEHAFLIPPKYFYIVYST